jgi:iron complex transport system substrate-binding protein
MRVVSLLPAGTEIVAALGALENLVGVTHECDFPAVVCSRARVTRSAVDGTMEPGAVDDAVRRLAGDGAPLYALDEKRIAALRPDLLLTQALCDVCAVSEADVRALAARLDPAPRVVTISASSLDGVLADIGTVAEALDLPDERDELITGLRARMRVVHGTLKEHEAPRPRVAVIEWTDPVYAAGHWVPEMVRRAGGVDVLAQHDAPSRTVTADEVRAADPEVIVIAPCGYDASRAERAAQELLERREWAWARDRRVWAVDANGLVSRPGPRLVDGIELFARLFNPALFSPVDDSHALAVSDLAARPG